MSCRVAVIGGASTYMPVLVRELAVAREVVDITELRLMDPDEASLRVIAGFCRGLAERCEVGLDIVSTCSLAEAVRGVDLVIAFYRAGGQEARDRDERIALQHGVLGQETQGFGGFASALRNVAVLKDIVREMKYGCPDAWLLDITNPVGIMTRAAVELGAKAVGICEVPEGMRLAIASALEVDPGSIDMRYAGLNHLGWIHGVRVDGSDMMSSLLADHLDRILTEARPANIPRSIGEADLAHSIRAIPSPYLWYYYQRDAAIELMRAREKTRAEDVISINSELMNVYRTRDYPSWESLAKKRGGYLLGQTVSHFLADLIGNRRRRLHVVCTRNNGALADLPQDAVVEVPVRIVNGAPAPICSQVRLHPHMWGLMSVVAAYETLTAQAGISGRYGDALQALATHPLVPTTELAARLVESTLTEFGSYLPQFERDGRES